MYNSSPQTSLIHLQTATDMYQWMDTYEPTAKYNIAETCCASISIDELVSLSENKEVEATDILSSSAVQNYGEIRGSSALRDNLSRLYSSKVGTLLSPDNILITNGAIAANHMVFYALLTPGDHVICHYPTYQQLYAVPASLGADVDLWKSKENNKWLPDFEELKTMVKENTKMIILKSVSWPKSKMSYADYFTATLKIQLELFCQNHCSRKSSSLQEAKISSFSQTKSIDRCSTESRPWTGTFHLQSYRWVTPTPLPRAACPKLML